MENQSIDFPSSLEPLTSEEPEPPSPNNHYMESLFSVAQSLEQSYLTANDLARSGDNEKRKDVMADIRHLQQILLDNSVHIATIPEHDSRDHERLHTELFLATKLFPRA